MVAPEIDGTLRLPANADELGLRAVVRLEDTTFADAPSLVVAETECEFEPGRAGHACFTLHVPQDAIREGRRYVLSARAETAPGGRARLFGTVQSYPWHSGVEEELELRELD